MSGRVQDESQAVWSIMTLESVLLSVLDGSLPVGLMGGLDEIMHVKHSVCGLWHSCWNYHIFKVMSIGLKPSSWHKGVL